MQSTLRSSSAHVHSSLSRDLTIHPAACDTQCGPTICTSFMRPQAHLSTAMPIKHSRGHLAELLESNFTSCRHAWASREASGFPLKRTDRRASSGARAAAAGATLPAADNKWALYEALGIARDVGLGEVKSAYRQLARRYHPDVCPAEEKTACVIKFIEVGLGLLSLQVLLVGPVYDLNFVYYRVISITAQVAVCSRVQWSDSTFSQRRPRFNKHAWGC